MSTEIAYLPSERKTERKYIVVERELEIINKKHGKVDVDTVLKEAAKPNHPLHLFFEWNDAAAAEKYRRDQAYTMIMATKFVVQLIEHKQVVASANVRKLVNPIRGEGFRMRLDALKNADERKALIVQKKASLRSWCDSVIDIEELAPLRKLILAKL